MSSKISNQGIVSILGYEFDQITKAASLRRTLSADMSSKPWLAQNGFLLPPMKRVASSEELTNKNNGSSFEPTQDDIWASIVSQKAKSEGDSTLPPHYVHPLVKRSSSALSNKSLEICTESLGSETGSDRFSSYAPSETGDTIEDKDVAQVTQLQPQEEKEKWQPSSLKEPPFAKYNFSTAKKSPPKSFPPPIPSMAQRDGPSLHMKPHREDGRLVLEAISIPSQNCFRAHRQEGRLLLAFANNTLDKELDLEEVMNEEDEIDEVDKEVSNNFEGEDIDYVMEEDGEVDEEEEGDPNEDEVIGKFQIVNGEKDLGLDRAPNFAREVINVHRSALVTKRLIGLNNRDPKWTEKIKKAINLGYMEMGMENYVDPTPPISQFIPRPPTVARLIQTPPVAAAAASFNACEYFWRTKSSMESPISPISQNNSPLKMNTGKVISPAVNKNREMLLMRGNKGDYLVPLLRGCQENKKSLHFWEPYCITTS